MRKRIIAAIKRFIINTVREDIRDNGDLRQVIAFNITPDAVVSGQLSALYGDVASKAIVRGPVKAGNAFAPKG